MAEEREIATRLGTKTIAMDKVVHFPRGLIGFEDQQDFTLLQINPGAPFLVLQSITDPTLGLLVADPYAFFPDYQIKIGDAEQKILTIAKREDLAVLTTVAIPPEKPEFASLNLSGPILINYQARVGLQVPQPDMKALGTLVIRTSDFSVVTENRD